LIVAADLDLGAQFSEVLDEVVGKGIIVVEDEDQDSILNTTLIAGCQVR